MDNVARKRHGFTIVESARPVSPGNMMKADDPRRGRQRQEILQQEAARPRVRHGRFFLKPEDVQTLFYGKRADIVEQASHTRFDALFGRHSQFFRQPEGQIRDTEMMLRQRRTHHIDDFRQRRHQVQKIDTHLGYRHESASIRVLPVQRA